MIDTNSIIREYLAVNTGVSAIVGGEVYWPRLPENASLPAVSLFTRGGVTNPHIETLPCPSTQIDCWAISSLAARTLYRAVYDALEGIQRQAVTLDGTTYYIMSAVEEVQGQDLVDVEIQGYFRCLSFWQFMVR